MIGLSNDEDLAILTWSIWSQYHAASAYDRQTNGRTELLWLQSTILYII